MFKSLKNKIFNKAFRLNLSMRSVFVILTIFLIVFFMLINLLKELSTYLPDFLNITFPRPPFSQEPQDQPVPDIKDIKKFTSEQEFKDYLQEASFYGGLGIGGGGEVFDGGIARISEGSLPLLPLSEVGKELERVSGTNVQVLGIDEPDIVKTDGKEIYFSREMFYGRFIEESFESMPPYYREPRIDIIKAFPLDDLSKDGEIKESGNLLLIDDILVVFSNNRKIYGYDISNPGSPQKKWQIELEDNHYLVGARLYKSKIYLVASGMINTVKPCPIEPLSIKGEPVVIKCTDIYHPLTPVPVDTTLVALVLDPKSGTAEKNIPFVGSSGSSVVYMSEKAIYITYFYQDNFVKFFYSFLKEKCQDLFPNTLLKRIERLESYDLSQETKMLELSIVIERYLSALDRDERLRVQNEMNNRMQDYYKLHKRNLEKSGIVKIDIEKLEIAASGNVPGYPVNQFALDEYNGYLRIATTVGQTFFGWGVGLRTDESANDIYVLDKNLLIKGSIKDLGLTERIYSARFVEDKGYLVTFRQIDPFYVLDLSNPAKPELKGELKIPGYSSYLHPIDKNRILGIGQENWQVKISLFDVSSPADPKELDKYALDDSWSEILSTHHAFLIDKKYSVFFLPGGRGGYVFSYQDDKLELKRAVSGVSAKRAVYINDFLYILGEEKITVLSEINWEKVKELEL